MKPYEALLGHDAVQWIGIDFVSTPSGRSRGDVFGSARSLPFHGSTFDTILCTQVLEHVPRPEVLLHEAQRVLKIGGHLILTAPHTNPLHEEPHDYFRFTCHGLRYLAEQAGFQVVEISPLGGAIATVRQMVVWHMNWLRRIPLIGSTSLRLATAAMARASLRLGRLSPMYGGGAVKDTLNWLLVGKKPAP